MLVLKNATILTMVDPAFVGDIAIQDRKIHALGKKLDYEDAEIIDLRGCYVLPGFIDAHSHIGLFESGTRETEHNERTNPITPHMRAIDGINPPGFLQPGRSLPILSLETCQVFCNLAGLIIECVKRLAECPPPPPQKAALL